MSLLEFLSTVDATRTVEFVGEALELLALVEITDATHLSGAVVAEWIFEHRVRPSCAFVLV